MLYLLRGEIYITPIAQQTKVYKDLKKSLADKAMVETIFYIFFMYTRKDNHYFARYSIDERREIVCSEYGLDFGEDIPEDNKQVKAFIDYYIDVQLTVSEKTIEVLKQKANHWRTLLYSESDPKAFKEIADALDHTNKLITEYELAAQKERNEDVATPGLYLFEVPENHKQPHQKYKLVS